MSVVHVFLGLLATGDRHGYDLKRQYDLIFPAAKPMAPAQVYASLDRLNRDGFIRMGATERVAGPDRTAYTVTDAGRAELNRWLDGVVVPSEFVVNPLAIKVTMALLVADRRTVLDYLHRQRAAHLRRMREHTRIKTDPHTRLAQVLAADYAINHLDADLRWIDSTLQRVDALSAELRP